MWKTAFRWESLYPNFKFKITSAQLKLKKLQVKIFLLSPEGSNVYRISWYGNPDPVGGRLYLKLANTTTFGVEIRNFMLLYFNFSDTAD